VGKSKKEVKTEQISEFCPQFAHQTKICIKRLPEVLRRFLSLKRQKSPLQGGMSLQRAE
jgi:hypothetical protein